MSEIVWGDPIEVNGKRPEWLEKDVPLRWSCAGSPYHDTTSTHCVNWRHDVLIRLPANHDYYSRCGQVAGAKAPDDWQPCERTVRACIEALPKCYGDKSWTWWEGVSRSALEALLPAPDPAEALVKEYAQSFGFANRDTGDHEQFARWLINTERLRP